MDKTSDNDIIISVGDTDYNLNEVNIDDIIKIDDTIDLSGLSGNMQYTGNTFTYNNTTINTGALGASGSYYISNGTGPSWSNNPYVISTSNDKSGLHVNGDAEFEGDIKWKGRSLGQMLETIEKRLSILQPDPEKLEHFEALRKAYEHYKTLEALCQMPPKEEDQ